MLAYYGFKDGSGDWFLIIDTDKCNGCSKCAEVCPANILEIGEDEYDPFNEELVAKVRWGERDKIRYSCAPCRPGYGDSPAPCVAACEPGAISQSEGWKLLYSK